VAAGWWSWALTGAGLICLWLMSSGKAWPWLVAAVGQTGWITFGATTGQHGFVVLGLSNAVLQVLGWRRTRRRLAAAEAVAS